MPSTIIPEMAIDVKRAFQQAGPLAWAGKEI